MVTARTAASFIVTGIVSLSCVQGKLLCAHPSEKSRQFLDLYLVSRPPFTNEAVWIPLKRLSQPGRLAGSVLVWDS